jgi:hypothetical protein
LLLPVSTIYNVYSYLQVKNKPHDEVAKTILYSSIWHCYEQFAFTFNTSQMSIKRRSINQSMKKQETGAKQVERVCILQKYGPSELSSAAPTSC